MPAESFQDMVPRSRIGIKLKVSKDGAQQEIELPLKLLVMGDFTLKEDETPVHERRKWSINKDNFDKVMKQMNLGLDLAVEDKLSGDKNAKLDVKLRFESLKDFEPARIAEQIPALKRLLQMRGLLEDLKARVRTKPKIRKSLQELLEQLAQNPSNQELVERLDALLRES